MRETTKGKNNGIQWTLFEQLDDLDFADDLALLAHNQNQMQDKTRRLEIFSAKTDLKINLRKTELIKINTTAKPFDAGFYKCSVHYGEHEQYLVMDGEQYVGGK